MAQTSGIEWTDATWNPVAGCSIVSPGCAHCYAMKMAARLEAMGQAKYRGLTKKVNGQAVWTGKITLDDEALLAPLKWKKPRRVFVNSMSDLFHEGVPFDFVDRVFAVMALCPQHTFQVLTKRPERMAEYFTGPIPLSSRADCVAGMHPTRINGRLFTWGEPMKPWQRGAAEDPYDRRPWPGWPLPNVWLGTSCEDQKAANERIPHLLRCPAAIRFLSCEPLIGPIDLSQACPHGYYCDESIGCVDHEFAPENHNGNSRIGWVIVGSESGPRRRAMKTEWAQSLLDQCHKSRCAFFMKQMEVGGKVTGDISLFPVSLRVRQFPEAAKVEV